MLQISYEHRNIAIFFFFLEKFPKVLIYANFKFQFLRDRLGVDLKYSLGNHETSYSIRPKSSYHDGFHFIRQELNVIGSKLLYNT